MNKKKNTMVQVSGGVVRKEALKEENNAKKLAEITSIVTGKEISFIDILYKRAIKLDSFIDERKILLREIDKGIMTLKEMPEQLKKEKKFVIKAIEISRHSFSYAAKELQSDEEVVLTAISNGFLEALTYYKCNEKLTSDKEFMIKAIKRSNGYAIGNASEELRQDKEIALLVARNNSYVFQEYYFPKEIRQDKELALIALKNGGAICHIPFELRSDRQFCLTTLRLPGINPSLYWMSDKLKGDKEIVLTAVRDAPENLYHASEKLLKNKKFLLETIRINPKSFQSIPENIKNNKSFVLKAIEIDIKILEFSRFKKDLEVALKAMEIDKKAFKYLSERIKKEVKNLVH